VLGATEKSIRIVHEMTNDETGEIAAITTIVGVHIDTTTRKARALPVDVHRRATDAAAGGNFDSSERDMADLVEIALQDARFQTVENNTDLEGGLS
jgi:hypothetical protein